MHGYEIHPGETATSTYYSATFEQAYW